MAKKKKKKSLKPIFEKAIRDARGQVRAALKGAEPKVRKRLELKLKKLDKLSSSAKSICKQWVP